MKNGFLRVKRLAVLIAEVQRRWPNAKLQPDNDKHDVDHTLSIYVPGNETTDGDYVGSLNFDKGEIET